MQLLYVIKIVLLSLPQELMAETTIEFAPFFKLKEEFILFSFKEKGTAVPLSNTFIPDLFPFMFDTDEIKL